MNITSSRKKRVNRWNHQAYIHYRKSSVKWNPGEEGYLKREFEEFNKDRAKLYSTFLSQVAYSLERSIAQVRAKLIEMNARGVIPRRSH